MMKSTAVSFSPVVARHSAYLFWKIAVLVTIITGYIVLWHGTDWRIVDTSKQGTSAARLLRSNALLNPRFSIEWTMNDEKTINIKLPYRVYNHYVEWFPRNIAILDATRVAVVLGGGVTVTPFMKSRDGSGAETRVATLKEILHIDTLIKPATSGG